MCYLNVKGRARLAGYYYYCYYCYYYYCYYCYLYYYLSFMFIIIMTIMIIMIMNGPDNANLRPVFRAREKEKHDSMINNV